MRFTKNREEYAIAYDLINNVIDGGYYGLYFYGEVQARGGYNTNIYIDINIIEKGIIIHITFTIRI